jgi:phage terminase large subunit-like protein
VTEVSPAVVLIDRLVARFGRAQAHIELDALLDQVQVLDLAALAYNWDDFWARPKQIVPKTDWRSFGFLTARGTGKTTSCANHIVEEIMAGRARCIGLCAQNEDKTIDVQVGGLIDACPPWFRPEWHAGAKQLVFPNGAVAYAHTPEVPGAIRSHNFDLVWLSEVQSWPRATMHEAYLNFMFATRVGYARTIWDATPKRRHPLLKLFLDRAEADPNEHIVRRGTIHENARNLGRGVIENLEREFGGTSAGREELLGEMLSESDAALVKQASIEAARRNAPERYKRRVIAIDPAVTSRAGNDKTGLIEAGLGLDGQAYVIADHSGRHPPAKWASMVLDLYVAGRCDCVVVETNKGGELVTQNLRAHADKKGLSVVVLGKGETPLHVPGTVYIREVHARGPKEDRAQPLATAYERGRVSHIVGADLAALEDLLTTWEPSPGQRSPDALDACVHAISELLGLANNRPDATLAIQGIAELGKALAKPPRPTKNLATLIGSDGGGRI